VAELLPDSLIVVVLLLFIGELLRWDIVGVTLALVSWNFFLELPFTSFKTECRVSDFFAAFFIGS